MTDYGLEKQLRKFLGKPQSDAEKIYNERSLQLEIGFYLRSHGITVEFERPFLVERPAASSKRPKSYLDILAVKDGVRTAIELKVPMNGRHPETLYDFCADLEFTEALARERVVEEAFCILLTNDAAFWKDSGRGSAIHDAFRVEGAVLHGGIQKPTGGRDTQVVLTGKYRPSSQWSHLGDERLMPRARYLLVRARP